MIDQLFGSRTRVKLLRIFLSNPEKSFFVRELTRRIGERINSVRRELENLESIGLLGSYPSGKKKFYRVDQSFILFRELKNLIVKSQLTLEKELTAQLRKIGQISFLMLTGVFTGSKNAKTDIFIVGKVNRKKLKRLVQSLRKQFDDHIRYTIMSKQEYEFRNNLTDKFLYDLMESSHVIIVDRLKKK